MRALVIDDSKLMRSIIGKILRDVGFDVVEAGDGCQALDVLRMHRDIELVLVDWNLPVMDGLEFVKEVRRQPTLSHLRLLMVTAETEREQVARALAEGANEYVMKPFTKEVIVEKLNLLQVAWK